LPIVARYLEILAIHPEYQSQRIGSRLLDHHLALVDSPDQTIVTAPAYLESSPEGNRLYKSRGYVEIGEVVAEGWDGGFPGMFRSPRSVQESS
jgi:ribosomal protein S18 acetylase RimI-like enzyme